MVYKFAVVGRKTGNILRTFITTVRRGASHRKAKEAGYDLRKVKVYHIPSNVKDAQTYIWKFLHKM